MRLYLSRLPELHEGFDLSYDADGEIKRLALVNGNKSDYFGPVIILNLDPHTVYGLSHPAVISRILDSGPQDLYTTKELAHKLFEHGMKAAWGSIAIKNNQFLTKLETFYTVKTSGKFSVGQIQSENAISVKFEQDHKKTLVLSSRIIKTEPNEILIYPDTIKKHLSIDL